MNIHVPLLVSNMILDGDITDMYSKDREKSNFFGTCSKFWNVKKQIARN